MLMSKRKMQSMTLMMISSSKRSSMNRRITQMMRQKTDLLRVRPALGVTVQLKIPLRPPRPPLSLAFT